MCDAARVSTQVASHTSDLPSLQAMNVIPSGLLPSLRAKPIGSNTADSTRWFSLSYGNGDVNKLDYQTNIAHHDQDAFATLVALVLSLRMWASPSSLVYVLIFLQIPFYQSSVFPIISTAMKIVNYSLILVCGTDCCEQTYKHTMRIARCIDHLLANKKLAIEEHKALRELRDLITTRPVSFNAMNFYTLNYHTMLSVASAVVTYTIILLQNMQ
ncbi:jg13452 [Pararge aegeria aegeria]|uniref:Jg13452 protein n=1 Tax=Pararge aegeria aegeria TaxID=348720 RepID=A0A8S4RUK5_9NEOP|nr:jg13452 [Pararge aegeria aegeria]